MGRLSSPIKPECGHNDYHPPFEGRQTCPLRDPSRLDLDSVDMIDRYDDKHLSMLSINHKNAQV